MRYVIYESMFGNTHAIAAAIAAGLGGPDDVMLVPVGRATTDLVSDTELVVVGGPTHGHSMSRPSTRKGARDMVAKDPGLRLEPDAERVGVREWATSIRHLPTAVAAFDTRVNAPAAFTGRASKSIARLLRRAGARLVAPPESFLVTRANTLVEGELVRAHEWGRTLAAQVERPRSEVGSE